MIGILRTAAALTATIALTACGGDRAPEQDADRTDAANEQAAADQLSPEAIARLTSQFAVLGEDPAPEPRAPSRGSVEVPARHREAAPQRVLQAATGEATFYADKFEGQRTASGIPFRQNQMVAAHRGFPFGTLLRVTNLDNDRSVNVRVVDRGPFGDGNVRPIIDLSRRAATQLGFIDAGRTDVRVEVLEWGDGIPQAS